MRPRGWALLPACRIPDLAIFTPIGLTTAIYVRLSQDTGLTRAAVRRQRADCEAFCERKKWHGRSIARALRARGIKPLTVSLASCGFSTATKTGLAIPGLGDRLPKGALVLFVPGGSFEQVTTFLGVLHALRELGLTVHRYRNARRGAA